MQHVYEFNISRPVTFNYTGKLETRSPDWMHDKLELTDYQLILVTKGTLYISYQDRNYIVPSGECLMLSPSAAPEHYREGFHPSDCSFYWIHFEVSHSILLREADLNFIPSENDSALYLPVQASVPDTDKMVVLLRQLQDSVRSGYNQTAADYAATAVLCELNHQLWHQNPDRELKNPRDSRKQIYYHILDHIQRNISTNLKIYDIANHFGYNEKYFSHMFRDMSGMNLKHYIVKKKIETANYLLTDTNRTVSEIAAFLGYTDSHNFMKLYKKETGLTPTEYRNAFAKRMTFQQG